MTRRTARIALLAAVASLPDPQASETLAELGGYHPLRKPEREERLRYDPEGGFHLDHLLVVEETAGQPVEEPENWIDEILLIEEVA